MQAAPVEPVGAALERPALRAVNPARSYLLGIAQAGQRLVAVGERGLIVLSDDQGATWRQAAAPVSVTLTAVRFADAEHGYAVGHGGSVLVSEDGGTHWTASLDGRRAAQTLLAAALAQGNPRAIAEAQRLVEDGPDKPFLDLWLKGPQEAYVVGAYGLALRTDDGGKSWQPWLQRELNPGGLHLNAIRSRGQRVVIAGEQGLVLISEDGGKHFREVLTPYSGSFFTLELPADGSIVLAGLRGNALRSEDGGETWRPLASPVEASITASALLADGTAIYANQAGMLLRERDGRLLPINQQPLPPLNNLLPSSHAGLILLGAEGVSTLNAGDVK
ncbi:MAG: WD40/YVTN/BNR-like repeat-containing protein [Ectopseudomonas guguanensis]|uniref:WD40/YVTN/BNR-like repeat-containing protein n=1 Tax=Ectopseudomonas guguanensis TaxID=1198456 RepID=UPI00391DC464